MNSASPARARELRRNQTDAEGRLWSHLRAQQVASAKFRRQVPIGPFVTDFCCMEVGLIVELDGGQHAERTEKDKQRTAFLESQGFRVLRFWNHDVLRDTEAVLARIVDAVEQCRREGRRYGSGGRVDRPHPSPLPSGRGDEESE